MFTLDITDDAVRYGMNCGYLGSMLAVTFSWARNRSILWAILAGVLSWLYVIHFALTRRDEERPSATRLSALRKRVAAQRALYENHKPLPPV